MRRRRSETSWHNVELLLDVIDGDMGWNESPLVMIGKSTSMLESSASVRCGATWSENVDEQWLWRERLDRAILGGSEELDTDLPTARWKTELSTGVKSSCSRTSPSLDESSSVSCQMAHSRLRLTQPAFTEESF